MAGQVNELLFSLVAWEPDNTNSSHACVSQFIESVWRHETSSNWHADSEPEVSIMIGWSVTHIKTCNGCIVIEASPELCRDSATVITRLSADTMDSSSYAHIPGTIPYLRASVSMDPYLFTLDLPRRRVSPLFVTICALGSVKPSDKSIEVSMSC